MSLDIIQEAKNKIYNSEIIQYVPIEKIEQAFQKIYVYDNQEELLEAFGRSGWKGERLEGFNRKDGSYLGPDATAHTVIHEVLHGISSKFDEQGHRIENGIMGDGSLGFANQVNEGLTDYLTVKLSGETPRHYIEGHKLFSKLEPMMIRYTQNDDILMQIYVNNDVQFMHDFLNYFGKESTFENLYKNFLFMDNEKIDDMLKPVEKNVNKYMKKIERIEKRTNIINKIKNIFSRNKTKMLTEGKNSNYVPSNEQPMNSHKEFINQYDLDNFQSNMTKEDEEKYNEYQQNIEENTQQQSIDSGRDEI